MIDLVHFFLFFLSATSRPLGFSESEVRQICHMPPGNWEFGWKGRGCQSSLLPEHHVRRRQQPKGSPDPVVLSQGCGYRKAIESIAKETKIKGWSVKKGHEERRFSKIIDRGR
ncbi:unnamed protein product [Scytosiphon promiscuus]